MELKKIRDLSDTDLNTQVAQAGEQMFRIRFQKSMGNLEGVKRLRSHKLDIARIKTVQRERELAAAREANPPMRKTAPAASQRTSRKKAERG